MNNKLLIKTLSYPLIATGIIMILLGSRWMIHNEPWMLDEVANVERLGMTFEKLFSDEINNTLPGYLSQIYKFFGFWIIVIGLFITNFSFPSVIVRKEVSMRLLSIVGFMIVMGSYLSYTLIPSSHFIFLAWGLMAGYILSLFSFYNLNKKNEK